VLLIVGEALTNARRHADARNVRVALSGSPAHLSVEVADDGKGLSRAALRSARAQTGMTGMRERAALLGGELDICSGPGAGTTVRLRVALGEDG
jgi:signal transduction histidine kinase